MKTLKNNLPFKEKLINGFYERTFSNLLEENDLKWHWDDEDRIIVCENNTNWKIQFDNELPQPIIKNKPIFIEKDRYHRLIKGDNNLKLKIKKLNESLGIYDNYEEIVDILSSVIYNEMPNSSVYEDNGNYVLIIDVNDYFKILFVFVYEPILKDKIAFKGADVNNNLNILKSNNNNNKFHFSRESKSGDITRILFKFNCGISYNDFVKYNVAENFRDYLFNSKNKFFMSTLAHELKHLKDFEKINKVGIKDNSLYNVNLFSKHLASDTIKNYLNNFYFLSKIEGSVYPSEVYIGFKHEYDIHERTKENFLKFLHEDDKYKLLIKIRDYTYNDFINELSIDNNNIFKKDIIKLLGDVKNEIVDFQKFFFDTKKKNVKLDTGVNQSQNPDPNMVLMNIDKIFENYMIKNNTDARSLFKKTIEYNSRYADTLLKKIMRVFNHENILDNKSEIEREKKEKDYYNNNKDNEQYRKTYLQKKYGK